MGKATLDPKAAGPRLLKFYNRVSELYKLDRAGEVGDSLKVDPNVLRYMKAATKATNDKYARADRAEVIAPLLIPEQASPPRRTTGRKKK
jgi:hypothetical protein